MSDTKIKTWVCVGTAILMALSMALLFGVIGIQRARLSEKDLEIAELEQFIDDVKIQSEKDYNELRSKYERVKKELKYEIEIMDSNDVVDMFFTNNEYLDRTAFIDDILREQFRHFIKLLDEMELKIVRRFEKVIQ